MNIRNQFTYAWRTICANRLCSVISVLGLGVGLACMILIAVFVWQEYTTDRFHKNYERMFVCTSRASDMDIPRLGRIYNWDKKLTDFPEVEAHVRVGLLENEELKFGEHVFTSNVAITEPGFFRVFSFPLSVGDVTNVLASPLNMIVTEKFAYKVFGNQNPMGQPIELEGKTYRIAGMMKDIPVNSSWQFDILVPDHEDFQRMMVEFFVLHNPSDIDKIQETMAQIKSINGQDILCGQTAFAGLYFNRSVNGDLLLLRQGDIRSLWILAIAACVILLISVVNYVNMYQVTLLKRDRELGVKRVHGISSWSLWGGFWAENFILVSVAAVLAAVLAGVLSGIIKQKMGIELQINWLFDTLLFAVVIGCLPLVVSVGPYWKYRHIQPATAMKNTGSGQAAVRTRKVLLAVQYTMTTVMLIVSFYFIRQLDYMLNKDLGIKKDHIIHTRMFKRPVYEATWLRGMTEEERAARRARNKEVTEQYNRHVQYVTHEIEKNPSIQHDCYGASVFDARTMSWKKGNVDNDYHSYSTLVVSPGYDQLYGMKLKWGRFFDTGKDRGRDKKVVVNETAMRELKLRQDQMTGLYCSVWGGPWEVIGVVEDFRFSHLSLPVQPMVMIYFGDTQDTPYQMQITPGKEQEVISFLNGLYKEIDPNGVFEYHFFIDKVEAMYAGDRKIVRIAGWFTVFAVLISSFGLFGFAFFDTRQRSREIGLRKVHGASIPEIIALLTRHFLRLIGIAFVVACPIAWIVIMKYRENYYESAPVAWWLFAVAIFITAGVALLTLIRQSYKAAAANPVDALRNE